MPAHKKTYDMNAVAAAAVTAINSLQSAGKKATVKSVTETMRANGQDIATTTCAALLKQLSSENKLSGFHLRRGRGFVASDGSTPTPKRKKSQQSLAKNIVEQMRQEERDAAEAELREKIRQEERARLGLAV